MFWFIWAISAYWFVFFKMQYQIYLLLPPVNDVSFKNYYKHFYILFYISFACYNIFILTILYKQCNFQVFFVDWEHEKDVLVKNIEASKPEKFRGAWRQINLINQFHELQTYNFFSCFFSFSFLLWFWYFFDWRLKITLSPTLKNSTSSPEHFILVYFLTSFVLIIVGLCTAVIQYLIMIIAFPKKTSEFIDLCVVSNISVLILDDLFHGYYINGQCPSGKSDVPLEKLAEMLEDESQGNIKQRGIGQDDIDTYEIYITHHFRNQYDDLYNLQSGNKPNRRIDQDDETFKYTKKYFKEHNENLDKMRPHEKYNTIGVIRRLLNAEIKENILRVFHEPTKYVKDLTSLMRIFEMPSVELTGNTRDNFVFFKDKNESYTKVLFDGIQWEL